MAYVSEEDIISAIVDEMRAAITGEITDVTDLGSNLWLVETECTKDIVAGQKINVGATMVTVKIVVTNVSFTVQTTTNIIAETTWSALAPYFFYGNPSDISDEIDRKNDDQNKNYPAIVLFEIKDIERTGFDSPKNNASIQMYFLDQHNPSDDTIGTIYGNIVDRMDRLAQSFIEQARKTRQLYVSGNDARISKESKWKVRVIQSPNGGNKTIFNNHLSGVGLSMTIGFSKNINTICNNC
jgi:hypothetical protein